MTETEAKFLILSAVCSFAAAALLWKRPVTGAGKLSLKLCLANALGWLLILPLSGRGHPPPSLFPSLVFWLANLVLLPSTSVALWVCRREGGERAAYLAPALGYVAANALVLFVLPVVMLARE